MSTDLFYQPKFIYSQQLERLLAHVQPQQAITLYNTLFSREGAFEIMSQWNYPGSNTTLEEAKMNIEEQMPYTYANSKLCVYYDMPRTSTNDMFYVRVIMPTISENDIVATLAHNMHLLVLI